MHDSLPKYNIYFISSSTTVLQKPILTFLTVGDVCIIPDDGNHGLTQILHQYLMFCQSELW